MNDLLEPWDAGIYKGIAWDLEFSHKASPEIWKWFIVHEIKGDLRV
jgi:hypothetical protein